MADGTMTRRVSVSLDADLVAEFKRSGPLSPQVNAALRLEVERRQRQTALQGLVDSLTATYGPLDTPADQAAIDRYVADLGGPDVGPGQER